MPSKPTRSRKTASTLTPVDVLRKGKIVSIEELTEAQIAFINAQFTVAEMETLIGLLRRAKRFPGRVPPPLPF